jgi:hypothetical protein
MFPFVTFPDVVTRQLALFYWISFLCEAFVAVCLQFLLTEFTFVFQTGKHTEAAYQCIVNTWKGSADVIVGLRHGFVHSPAA